DKLPQRPWCGEFAVLRVCPAGDQRLHVELERQRRRERDIESRLHHDRVLYQSGKDVAVAVERCREGIRDRLDVLNARLAAAQRRPYNELNVRSGTQLGLQVERTIAVAFAIAADVAVGPEHDLLPRIGVDVHEKILTSGAPHDWAPAGEAIIEDSRPVNPEGTDAPVVQDLNLAVQLHLPVGQVTVEVVLLLPAGNEEEIAIPLRRLGPLAQDVAAHPEV